MQDGTRPLAADFSFFYCAGATANAHNNPYLTVPYDACGDGHRAAPPSTIKHREPAPIPGYDVAIFKAFATLPFGTAAGLWLLIGVTAIVVGVLCVASITSLPTFIIFFATAIALKASLDLGQLPPILFAALAFTGYALVKKKYVLAGIAATVALIEPHVGIPAFIATFVWVPRSRLTLLLGAACLIFISLATLGISANVEYVRVVLPSQVFAEVPFSHQYSLTWLLYALGASDRIAVRIAEVQYAITILCGILLARPIAVRLNSPALIPLVAAGFSVIGGPYIHLLQVAPVAILLALVIAAKRNDGVAWASILLLAVSWDGDGAWFVKTWTPLRLECAIIATILTAYSLRRRPFVVRSVAAAASLIAYVAITTAILSSSGRPTRALDSPAQYISENAAAHQYSTFEWGLERRLTTEVSDEALLSKIPSWLGLLLLAFSVVRVLRTPPGAPQLRSRTQRTALTASL